MTKPDEPNPILQPAIEALISTGLFVGLACAILLVIDDPALWALLALTPLLFGFLVWHYRSRTIAETSVIESDRALREAQRAAKVGSWHWNVAEDDLQWSEELARIHGYPAETRAMDFERYLEHVDPDDRERVRGKIEEAIESREPFRFEHGIVLPSGETRTIVCGGLVQTGSSGEVVRLTGTARDVTERREEEHALRTEHDTLESLLRHSGEIVTVLDEDGKVRYRSPAFERILGYPPDTFEEVALPVVHPDDMERAERSIAEARERPGATSEPTRVRAETRTGEERILEGTATNLLQDPAVEGIVLNLRDVTDRVRSSRSLRASHGRLRRLTRTLERVREEERKRLSREIHDELGQLLTALRMDLVATSGAEAEREAATDRMLELVDRMLAAVRRIAAELRPAALDALGLVPAVEEACAEFSRRTRIDCGVEVEEGLPEPDEAYGISAFRILQEALTNVARHAEASRVEIRLRREGGDLFLEVRDDGRGFDPSRLEHAGGLGILGMRERAETLGGELEIESAPDEGCTVRLRLPAYGGEPKASYGAPGPPLLGSLAP